MSDFKPELSTDNPYHIGRHRYYELKHFCLQYPEWKKQIKMLEPPLTVEFIERFQRASELPNPTERIAIMRSSLEECCLQVERAALATDQELSRWILAGVTEGRNYENLDTTMGIPCSRDTYYDRYRKFFWILSKSRT